MLFAVDRHGGSSSKAVILRDVSRNLAFVVGNVHKICSADGLDGFIRRRTEHRFKTAFQYPLPNDRFLLSGSSKWKPGYDTPRGWAQVFDDISLAAKSPAIAGPLPAWSPIRYMLKRLKFVVNMHNDLATRIRRNINMFSGNRYKLGLGQDATDKEAEDLSRSLMEGNGDPQTWSKVKPAFLKQLKEIHDDRQLLFRLELPSGVSKRNSVIPCPI